MMLITGIKRSLCLVLSGWFPQALQLAEHRQQRRAVQRKADPIGAGPAAGSGPSAPACAESRAGPVCRPRSAQQGPAGGQRPPCPGRSAAHTAPCTHWCAGPPAGAAALRPARRPVKSPVGRAGRLLGFQQVSAHPARGCPAPQPGTNSPGYRPPEWPPAPGPPEPGGSAPDPR